MSIERDRLQTATDALITAMEDADEFEHVIVIAYRRDGNLAIITNDCPLTTRIGMVTFASVIITRQIVE